MSNMEAIHEEITRRMGDMSIAELARRAGLRYATLNDLLNGKTQNPRFTTLKRIADALGCTMGDLLRSQ